MKIATTQEYTDLMEQSDESVLGMCFSMETGDANSASQKVMSCFVVDKGTIHEIAVMTNDMINILEKHDKVTHEEALQFRLAWKKIIKRS